VKTREQISYNMSRVRRSGSMIERTLGKALWAAGLRYRKQYRKLTGCPDFVLVSRRIAIFCDSSFWHGRNWPEAAQAIKTNRQFWINKIEDTIQRDEFVNRQLRVAGWGVIRFWDYEILDSPSMCAQRVMDILEEGS